MNQDKKKETEKIFLNLANDMERILNFYSKEFIPESIIQYIIYQLTMTLFELGHSPKDIKLLFKYPMKTGISNIKSIKKHGKEKL